jgi:serine/threonine-protein kinase
MEYIPGLTLREFCRQGRLALDAAVFVVSRLALALDYLHNYVEADGKPVGLVHRDVTPSNVIISKAGHVKLVDFGIAKATALSSATQGNLLKGTYAYMSPEQLCGETLNAQSDIFSLGALLYELLTGRRAFDGDSVHDTMRRVRDCEWAWPETMVDEARKGIVEGCLRPKPADRYRSAADVYGALRSLDDKFNPLRLRTEWGPRL